MKASTSLIGRFLEISVQADDLATMLQKYTGVGFRELATGDAWPHGYAVVSDGHVNIGLHESLPLPIMLTFVHPHVFGLLDEIRGRGIDPDEVRLGPDEFNLIRFRDPNEIGDIGIQVIEARTFSPPVFDERHISDLGTLKAIEMPVSDNQDEHVIFWERLGLRQQAKEGAEDAAPMLHAQDCSLALSSRVRLGDVRLRFESSDGATVRLDVSKP